MDEINSDLIKTSTFGDNNAVLTALASLFAIQNQGNEKNDSSLNAPFLVLTNVPGKDSLLANVILGTSHSKNGFAKDGMSENKESLVPSFEQVHAIATANLIASTQLDIVKQLAEENAQSKQIQTTRSKDKRLNKQPKKERKCKDKKTAKTVGDSSTAVNKEYLSNVVSGPRALVCSFEGCNRKFAWVNHLKYHELTHTNNRQYKCPDESCGKTFFTAQRLNVHLLTHTGVRPFKCDHQDCGKTFTTAGNLKNHQRIHTGEQPFVCDVRNCNRRFTEHSSLKKHKLIHSGDKPFECDICGKKFTQSGSRRQHLIRHHLEDEIRNSFKQDIKEDMVQEVKKEPGVSIKGGSTTQKSDHLSNSPQVLVLNNTYQEPMFQHTLSDCPVTVSSQSISQTVNDTASLSLSHVLLNSEELHDETLDEKQDELVVMSEIYQHTDNTGDIVYTTDILDHEEVTHASCVSPHVDYSGQITPACYSHHEEIIHASDYSGQELSQSSSFPPQEQEITATDYVSDACISSYEPKELGHTFIDDTRHGFIGAEEIAVSHYSNSPNPSDLVISEIVTTSDCVDDIVTGIGMCTNKSCVTLSTSGDTHHSCTLVRQTSDLVGHHSHSAATLGHTSSESDIHMDPMMECD
ncbi:hypothetical protein Btru_012122 [Bulinus truncatus]|nr:hypothetical protein Btru_012122 [Bulinus truncatus]